MGAPETLNLHDILPPAPVDLWPPPLLFWVVLTGFFLLAALAIRALIPTLKRQRNRQRALKAWQMILDNHWQEDNPTEHVNRLLKNLLVTSGHVQAISLNGQNWHAFLTQRLPEKDHAIVTLYVDSLYRPTPLYDRKQLEQIIPRWIRKLS